MHFYEQTDNGVQARHFVEMSTRQGTRPSRMADARKAWAKGARWVPSVTTVLNCLDKGALTRWLIDQHLHAAWLAGPEPFEEYEYPEDYASYIKRLAEQEMEKAPTAGTDMHKVLEGFMGPCGVVPDDLMLSKICFAVAHALGDNCVPDDGDFYDDWGVEQYFVSPMGYGGCADLVGDGWVIDYKTKQTADKFKPGRMAYDDHRMQLAAYREGFGMPNARCANIFICLETGEIDFHEHKPDELAKGWAMFTRALEIWQIRNDYPADLMVAA